MTGITLDISDPNKCIVMFADETKVSKIKVHLYHHILEGKLGSCLTLEAHVPYCLRFFENKMILKVYSVAAIEAGWDVVVEKIIARRKLVNPKRTDSEPSHPLPDLDELEPAQENAMAGVAKQSV